MDATGAAIVWVGLLWPVLVAAGFLLWKRRGISRKLRFFIRATAVGYLALVAASAVATIPVLVFMDDGAVSPTLLTVVLLPILMLTPALAMHHLLKESA